MAMPPQAVAETIAFTIAFTIAQPDSVDIGEVIVRPTIQP
jgi:NADP-dependent 3-hydroxy acid dehydrogenase YdfG